jgi:hypothetical protein
MLEVYGGGSEAFDLIATLSPAFMPFWVLPPQGEGSEIANLIMHCQKWPMH